MSIPHHARANFNTLLRAAEDGRPPEPSGEINGAAPG